jgi:hypothetical protein
VDQFDETIQGLSISLSAIVYSDDEKKQASKLGRATLPRSQQQSEPFDLRYFAPSCTKSVMLNLNDYLTLPLVGPSGCGKTSNIFRYSIQEKCFCCYLSVAPLDNDHATIDLLKQISTMLDGLQKDEKATNTMVADIDRLIKQHVLARLSLLSLAIKAGFDQEQFLRLSSTSAQGHLLLKLTRLFRNLTSDECLLLATQVYERMGKPKLFIAVDEANLLLDKYPGCFPQSEYGVYGGSLMPVFMNAIFTPICPVVFAGTRLSSQVTL